MHRPYIHVRTKSAAAVASPATSSISTKVLDPAHAQLKVVDVSEDAPGGYLEGYASVFGNVDSGGDVVEKGAFTKTLKERLKKGAIKFVDSHLVFSMMGGTKTIVGVVVDAKEDDYGLWFRAKLSTVQDAQDIRTKVKEGILNALSFGYDVVKEEPDKADPMVRHLKELKLYEISVVPWGMNEKAQLTAAKSWIVSGFACAKDADWDSAAASGRWQRYVSDKPVEEWGEVEWNRYKRGFIHCDTSAADSFEGYKHLVVDVIGGTPKYVLKAANLALSSIRQDADFSGKEEAESQLKELYAKFGEQMPAPEVPPAEDPKVASIISGMKAFLPDPFAAFLGEMKSAAASLGIKTGPVAPPEYRMVAADDPARCATCFAFEPCEQIHVNGKCCAFEVVVMKNGLCNAFSYPTPDQSEDTDEGEGAGSGTMGR